MTGGDVFCYGIVVVHDTVVIRLLSGVDSIVGGTGDDDGNYPFTLLPVVTLFIQYLPIVGE